MTKIVRTVSVLIFLISLSALAADKPTPAAAPAATSQANLAPVTTVETVLPAVTAPEYKGFRPVLGIKSQNTTGRAYEMDDKNGRRYKLKTEYYGGIAHKAGWSFYVQGQNNDTTFGDKTKNAVTEGDASVTLAHPIYDNGTLKFSGQLRRYIAVTDRSKDRNQRQYAYYVYTSYKMKNDWSLFNQFTPRYFDQDYYKPTDTTQYVEDYTTLTKKVNYWFKYGVGQHTQVEWHKATEAGTVVEMYPFADFVLSKNMLISPRVYLPVQKTNVVYDSPLAVSLNNAQFEVYMQMSL